jgi:cytochrome c-type biogenesis protein CcmH
VFVFARAVQGPSMPLAVKRGLVSDLPMDFVLDDSSAMSPEFKQSSMAEVRVEVRVSRNGSATPSAGDLIGQGPVVKPGATGVAVQIDQIRP